MFSLRKAILMATVAAFVAQPVLALTVHQTNVAVGGGVYVPAIIIMDGPMKGTYKIGDQGLTRAIIYNQDAMVSWAAALAGVAQGTVTIYEPEANSSSESDDCEYDASFDADLTADNLIYLAATEAPELQPKVATKIPCKKIEIWPCDKISSAPSSTNQLVLTQWVEDCIVPSSYKKGEI